MRFLASLSLACALALTAQPSATADSAAVGEQTNWFKTHDRNGDSYITYEEVIGYEVKLFKRADKNGDGKLSESEFLAGVPQDQPDAIARYKRRFTAMDKNHDRYVTVEEMTVFYKFVIKTSDTNGDGYVSLEEWLGATEGE